MNTTLLAADEILRIHYQLIEEYGGVHGVVNEDKLAAVIAAPSLQVDNEQLYVTPHEQAASYLKTVIMERPFSAANKATAVAICGVFLARNKQKLNATPTELENFISHVNTGRPSVYEIAAWLRNH